MTGGSVRFEIGDFVTVAGQSGTWRIVRDHGDVFQVRLSDREWNRFEPAERLTRALPVEWVEGPAVQRGRIVP